MTVRTLIGSMTFLASLGMGEAAFSQTYVQMGNQRLGGEASQRFWNAYQGKTGDWARFVEEYKKPENRERLNRSLASYNEKAVAMLRDKRIHLSFARGTPEIEKALVLLPLVAEYRDQRALPKPVSLTYVTSPQRQDELATALGLSKADLGFDGTATAVFNGGFTVKKSFSEEFQPGLEYVFDRKVQYVQNGNAITIIDPTVSHFPAGTAGIREVNQGEGFLPAAGSSLHLFNVGIKGFNGVKKDGSKVELLANLPAGTVPTLVTTYAGDHVKYSVYYGADRYSFTQNDVMLVLYKDNEMRATSDLSFRDAGIQQVFIAKPDQVDDAIKALAGRKDQVGMLPPNGAAIDELLRVPGLDFAPKACRSA